MPPTPLYLADDIRAAYHLRYVWTGWPSTGSFPSRPAAPFFSEVHDVWESDGIRVLERQWTPTELTFVSSLRPDVSPVQLAKRMKGRLDYALRKRDTPVKFSRKFSVRTVGENRRDEVERYIDNQVANSSYADPNFRGFLERFTICDDSVDLSEPSKSSSARYWYALHMVLTVRDRSKISKEETFRTIRDRCFGIAAKKGYAISRLSVMPDHVHLSLRGNYRHSPEEIALGFLNNLAYALNQHPIWQASFYAGTIGEYDMDAIRQRVG